MNTITDQTAPGNSDSPAEARREFDLDPAHLDDLRHSGLSETTIAACEFTTIRDPAETALVLNWNSGTFAAAVTPAMAIPYFDTDGVAVENYVRLKPTTPRADAKDSAKFIKYESPKGAGNRAYFPPVGAGWLDSAVPLIVTEGEKKAAKACQEGFLCVGLVGVWGWQVKGSKGEVRELIPDLAALPWKGRKAFVIFDSDAASNGKVRDAQRHLARSLTKCGADVRVVTLPSAADGSKQGLDDFLIAAGLEALALMLDPPAPPADAPRGDAEKKEKPPTAADILARIGCECDLFHDDAGEAYATVGRKTHPVRSKAFRQHLIANYRKLCAGKVPNAEAVAAAVNAVEAEAVYGGPCRLVFVRVAAHGGAIYYDLCDAAGTVIEIDARGWRECPDPPVRFVAPPNAVAQVVPTRGGPLADLRRFVNCPGEDEFALLLAFIAASLRVEGPFPLLVLTGEQGSAKSTTARVLKELLDPARAAIRCEPKESRDLMISACGAWLLAYDNLSGVPVWLSDALCRLSTGGGFGVRTHYENAAETVFDAKRPVVLNGITDYVTRADLLERSIVLRHPPIEPGARRRESQLNADFAATRPALLGALFDYAAGGLRELAGVDDSDLPRMADAAAFALACERGAGSTPRFREAYRANQGDAHESAMADSPIAGPLCRLMESRDRWEGTATELLNEVSALVSDPKPRDWPKKPNAFTNRLRRDAPALRRTRGIDVNADCKLGDRNKTRRVVITRGKSRTGADGHPGGADDPGRADRPNSQPTNPSISGDAGGAGGLSRSLWESVSLEPDDRPEVCR